MLSLFPGYHLLVPEGFLPWPQNINHLVVSLLMLSSGCEFPLAHFLFSCGLSWTTFSPQLTSLPHLLVKQDVRLHFNYSTGIFLLPLSPLPPSLPHCYTLCYLRTFLHKCILSFTLSLFPPVAPCPSPFPLQSVPLGFPTWFYMHAWFYMHVIYACMLLHIHIKSRNPKMRENMRYLSF